MGAIGPDQVECRFTAEDNEDYWSNPDNKRKAKLWAGKSVVEVG